LKIASGKTYNRRTMPEISSDDKLKWLSLYLITGIGNITIKNLLEKFETPDQVFEVPATELAKIKGVRREVAKNIAGKKYQRDPESVFNKIERIGARIIIYTDPEYPDQLRKIYDPPMIIFVKGEKIPRQAIFIAMVGSRHPTPYGQKSAHLIAQGLARRGIGIVSGMALGIDATSHSGCLFGKGYTLAVLGTGIDIIYPESNRKLHQEIINNGSVITEYLPGTPPEPKNFPIRNRIISGISSGVVVVEATKKSGSLITATLALDQGRDVFAVPGSIHSFKSTGCHLLIKQGARLIENSDDILDELGLNYPFAQKTDTFKEKQPSLPMDEMEKKLYQLIGDYPTHIDQIARQGKLSSGEVSSILMKMELKGLVRQLPGKAFVR